MAKDLKPKKVLIAEAGHIVEANHYGEIDLKFLQEVVGGRIECFYTNDELGYDLFCNEEGKFLDLHHNMFTMQNGEIYDLIMGSVVAVGHDEEGNSVGLTDEAIEDFKMRFTPENHRLPRFETGRELHQERER